MKARQLVAEGSSTLTTCGILYLNTTPSIEAVHCFICDRRRVVVTRHGMICLVPVFAVEFIQNYSEFYIHLFC